MSDSTNSLFVVITPCFNEGPTISRFLENLETVLSKTRQRFIVVVVDDSSTDDSLEIAKNHTFSSDNVQLHVLGSLYNSGHQGAIYSGLKYAKELQPDYTIVMDSDGEDNPEAIPLLLAETGYDIVEVRRGKRSESLYFRIFYKFYKLLFRMITGRNMDFGNYSMISNKILQRVADTSFIHFPAYLLKQKAHKKHIVFDRGKRIDGKSKMGMQGLLFHAFRSFIEFAEDLLMVFLKIFVFITIIISVLFVDLLYQKFVAHTAILGWFSTLTVSLIILAIMCLGFFVLGILMLNIMHQRKSNGIIYTVEKK